MKTTKKVVMTCMLAAAAAGLVFAGGSKDKKASDNGKTVLSVLGYGTNANQEGLTFKRIVKAFQEENPDIVIEDEMLFDEAYHQKVTARLASGDVPDVAYMGSDARWGGPWDEAKQHADMRADMEASGLYDMAKIGPDTADGKYYYVPLGTANYCTTMFVNTDLLKKLGFGVPKTYADLKAMVSKASANGVEVLSIHGADAWTWGSCLLSTVLAQTTGDKDWVNKLVAGKVKFTDPDAVASLAFLKTMVDDGVLSSDSILVDDGTGKSNFSSGKYICYLDGQWGAGGFTPERQEQMTIVPFPAVPGAKGNIDTLAAAKQVGYGYTKACVDAGKTAAAMKFINYYNSVEETTQRLRDGGVTGSILKDYKMPDDMPTVIKLKNKLGVYKITPVIDSILTGAPNDALLTGCQQVVTGELTPKQAAEAVQAALK
ncbi:MAG: extracellular solute-binding protein [Treponema sp.]|jgi:raffinose/stachyose/melibiose transport system substrate-binding protein|nr:extracellular solute-binding protein [Treponema sp.]